MKYANKYILERKDVFERSTSLIMSRDSQDDKLFRFGIRCKAMIKHCESQFVAMEILGQVILDLDQETDKYIIHEKIELVNACGRNLNLNKPGSKEYFENLSLLNSYKKLPFNFFIENKESDEIIIATKNPEAFDLAIDEIVLLTKNRKSKDDQEEIEFTPAPSVTVDGYYKSEALDHTEEMKEAERAYEALFAMPDDIESA